MVMYRNKITGEEASRRVLLGYFKECGFSAESFPGGLDGWLDAEDWREIDESGVLADWLEPLELREGYLERADELRPTISNRRS